MSIAKLLKAQKNIKHKELELRLRNPSNEHFLNKETLSDEAVCMMSSEGMAQISHFNQC